MLHHLREPINTITHFLGALLALIGLIWLVTVTYPDIDRMIISLVYGICTILTFTASTVMHSYRGDNRILDLLIRLDHAAIFLMIAGTYTPFAYIFLDTLWFIGMMVAVWGLALGGVVWKFVTDDYDSKWSLLYYLGMGWLSVILLPHLLSLIDLTGFVLIVSGGVIYTIGAFIFGFKYPNFNRWWGHHEIWHVFVLVAAALHFFSVAYHLV